MASGRKPDAIWDEFSKLKIAGKQGSRAVCKRCNHELQGIVDRMKKHYELCSKSTQNVEQSNKTNTLKSYSKNDSKDKNSSVEKFIVKTTKKDKESFDEQIARFFFATNLAFHKSSHVEFKNMCNILHPGYVPPNERQLANDLLDKVYLSEQNICFENFKNEIVCLTLDGWSNVNNNSIICACIIKKNGFVALVDTIDTSGHAHTSQYLQDLTLKICHETEIKNGCKIRSLVTDNASNMTKMRKNVEEMDRSNIICYGCSAHIMNLLAHDLGKDFGPIQKQIVSISKYFRNHHLQKFWYTEAGGSSLILLIEVRWNSMCGTIKAYLKNWSILMKVCDEHRNEIDAEIIKLVQNLDLKRNCEDLLAIYQPIATALDLMQSDTCKIADSVVVWKHLENDFEPILNTEQKKIFVHRYKMALKACHYAAFLISPTKIYIEEKLTEEEKIIGMSYIEEEFPIIFLSVYFKFLSKIQPFTGAIMREEVIKTLTDFDWWKSFISMNPTIINDVCEEKIHQLLTAVASSAGVERMFLSFGQVHSDLRNKFGVEKAAKLTFLYKQLNNNNK
jgi:hypothetical protein